jgi:hypothetical protein
MQIVVDKLQKLAKQVNPREFVRSANLMLLELVRKPKATVKELQSMIEELKTYNYIVQYQILQVKGY